MEWSHEGPQTAAGLMVHLGNPGENVLGIPHVGLDVVGNFRQLGEIAMGDAAQFGADDIRGQAGA